MLTVLCSGFGPEIIAVLVMLSRMPGVMAHWREAMSKSANYRFGAAANDYFVQLIKISNYGVLSKSM